ncbi:methyltransferase domain-containing protein [Enterococcus durans]|uniref:methyltransferase domain-containing protein n=1 Tax=Enterococcus durans TaxID=53345 RepID=UPI0011BED3F7|nr:class I SAM-dependent methyltransferase [Enterococcus durans]QED60457.1 methyltransferase domain-containing protein [Enterococcus durans]QED63029.1 methyltransferase domain-containing protein [Enterococcus durans]
MDEIDWDEFAPAYYQNQLESRTTIVEDVIAFLKSKKVLPASDLIDVAGGAGRYLPMAKEVGSYKLFDFSTEMLRFAQQEENKLGVKNIQMMKQSFEAFLENKESAEVIFTAANPALDNTKKLEKMLKKMNQACVILRVVRSRDDLFILLEERLGIYEADPTVSPDLMDFFETFLTQNDYSYQTQEFTYVLKEEITRSLMEDYYEEYKEDQRLTDFLDQHFLQNEQISTTRLTYRLLLIQ